MLSFGFRQIEELSLSSVTPIIFKVCSGEPCIRLGHYASAFPSQLTISSWAGANTPHVLQDSDEARIAWMMLNEKMRRIRGGGGWVSYPSTVGIPMFKISTSSLESKTLSYYLDAIQGSAKKVCPRLREYRLLAPSGTLWQRGASSRNLGTTFYPNPVLPPSTHYI